MIRQIALFASLALICSAASAQQLYKWVDKDGKISYSDTPPPKDAGKVSQKRYGDNAFAQQDDLPFATRDAQKRNPVVLFANACGELCDGARKLLTTRGVPFTERNPETDPAALEALKKAAGTTIVPVLMVGETVIKGFDDAGWAGALTAAGYPSTVIRRPAAPPPPPAAPAKDSPPAGK